MRTMMEKGKYPFPKENYIFKYPELYDDSKLILGENYCLKLTLIELENGSIVVFSEHVPVVTEDK